MPRETVRERQPPPRCKPGDARAHPISVNMLRLRVTAIASRARKMASPPTARPASPARTESSSRGCSPNNMCRFAEMAAHFQRDDGKRDGADPEPARHVDQFGIGPARCRRFPARAPCRRSGRSRARLRISDASGRCRWCLPAQVRACARAQIFLRIGDEIRRGSRRNRNNRYGRDIPRDAWRCADRPSCRRRGR